MALCTCIHDVGIPTPLSTPPKSVSVTCAVRQFRLFPYRRQDSQIQGQPLGTCRPNWVQSIIGAKVGQIQLQAMGCLGLCSLQAQGARGEWPSEEGTLGAWQSIVAQAADWLAGRVSRKVGGNRCPTQGLFPKLDSSRKTAIARTECGRDFQWSPTASLRIFS